MVQKFYWTTKCNLVITNVTHTLICVTSPSCCIESKCFGGKSLIEFPSSEVSPHSSKALSCIIEFPNKRHTTINYNNLANDLIYLFIIPRSGDEHSGSHQIFWFPSYLIYLSANEFCKRTRSGHNKRAKKHWVFQ